MFMLGKPSTMPDSDFASVLTSTDCSNSEVFVHVGQVITILTCNLTSTLQGLDMQRMRLPLSVLREETEINGLLK